MREVRVGDSSAAAEARRLAAELARSLAYDDVATGQVAIVASELATNLYKHATEGRLLIGHRGPNLQLVAIDRGPGIADIEASLVDGYSTAGTAGNGLGAVRRLSRAFHIASWSRSGTAVYARLGVDASPHEAIGAIEVPLQGQAVSGDAWASHEDATGRTLFVVDGLGHGTDAAIAAREAVREFERCRAAPPDAIIDAVHRAIRHTRGGAVAAARIEWGSRTVVFCGLGNIAGVVIGLGGTPRRMVSHNGTAGHNARKIQSFEYPYTSGPLVMHSDGLSSNWSLDAHPGIARVEPMLLAGVLYRDHGRGRDDATVVVAKTSP